MPTTLESCQRRDDTEDSRIQVEALDKNARDFGINYYPVFDASGHRSHRRAGTEAGPCRA